MEYVVINGSEKQLHDLEYMFPDVLFSLERESKTNQEQVYLRSKNNKLDQLSEKAADIPIEKWIKRLNVVQKNYRSRKIAIWGTGIAGEITTEKWNSFYTSEIKISCYIDSFPVKDEFYKKPVYRPSEVKDLKNYYIILANENAFSELKLYLEERGMKEEEDFVGYKTAFSPVAEMFLRSFYDEIKTNKICKRPFGYADIINDAIYLCCPASTKFTSVGTISESSFESIWHGDLAKIYRMSIVNGTYSFCNPDFCDKCNLWGREEYQYKEEAYLLREEKYPSDMMLGLDDSCNLRCPSCRNEFWVDTDAENVAKKIDRTRTILGDAIAEVKYLWLAGAGEVFVSKVYRAIMDEMCCGRKNLSILSNGVLFDEDHWDLYLRKYEYIDLIFSMDGATKETYERLRRGGTFEKIMKNIKFASELRKEGKVNKFQINLVLQADNVMELPLFIKLAEKYDIDRIHIIKFYDYHIKSREEMEKVIIVDEKRKVVKDSYRKYFTKEILQCEKIDWSYMANYLGEEFKESIFESEFSLF